MAASKKYLLNYTVFSYYLESLLLYSKKPKLHSIPSYYLQRYFGHFDNVSDYSVIETLRLINDNFILIESVPVFDLIGNKPDAYIRGIVSAVARNQQFTVYCFDESETEEFKGLVPAEVIPENKKAK